MARITFGFLLAPLLHVGVLYALASPEAPLGGRAWSHPFIVLILELSYICILAFGVQAVPWFRERRWLRWWHSTLAGALCGAALFLLPNLLRLVVVLILKPSEAGSVLPAMISWTALGALNGAGVAFWFWVIAVWRNPAVKRSPAPA